MAWYDDQWQDAGEFLNDDKPDVMDVLFGGFGTEDLHAQDLFAEAFFDKNETSRLELNDYLWDMYGIDFEAEFNWAEYRDLDSP